MMKKSLIVCAALILAVALCACGQSADELPVDTPEITASETPEAPLVMDPEASPPETSAEMPQDTPEATPASESPSETPSGTTPSTAPSESPSAEPSPSPDKYGTEPVPAGKAEPVEPEDVSVGDTAFTCTLSVRCDTILEHMDDLAPDKLELVPEDGVIFATTTVTFYEGESVFNVLQREMKRAKIHMEFVNTPIYNSAYIEGINNLYEFDCGELSGWMYKVNDWFPNYGCSRYQLKDGDVVEWVYTCDLGRDVGGFSAAGS